MALFSFLLQLKQQGMFYVCWAQCEKPGCATDTCASPFSSCPWAPGNSQEHWQTIKSCTIPFLKNHYASDKVVEKRVHIGTVTVQRINFPCVLEYFPFFALDASFLWKKVGGLLIKSCKRNVCLYECKFNLKKKKRRENRNSASFSHSK